jgi:4-amino-4-deoxy-L-arabinose transferase-like glycosyltransferase
VEEPLVPPGNALRPRALAYVLPAMVGLVVLMASDAHCVLSVPLGLLCASVATLGLLDFTGCFDDRAGPEPERRAWSSLWPRLLELLGALLAWTVALRLAVAGVLPGHGWSAPVLASIATMGVVVALGRVLVRVSPNGASLTQRSGFWLLLLGVALYVPLLGSYSLLDPWETHYGEVAREMLARDDWLSLWWAQDGWFWSKPALDFWLQGLAFALLGVRFAPDQMLEGAAHGALPQPEWAARVPVVLLSLLAVYALYRFVAKATNARAGFLAGLALLCMPYWSLLSHQSMTDMPYVAPLSTALALFGLALLTDADELVTSYELTLGKRVLRLSAFHALLGLVIVSALPQLCYLVSRNVTLQIVAPPYGFRWHWDELFSGSGLGNCGLPGNEACRGAQPANFMFQPALGALVFGAALGYLLQLNRGERRKKRLFYLAAWYFTALAALAKGAPGLVLPVVVVLAVLVVRRRWTELLEAEPAGLCLTFAAVALPWYVQAYMRHGEPFTDRLLFHDMYKRAFVHVHDTNTGIDTSLRYYLWQLGYGIFPWSGLAVLGSARLLAAGDEQDVKPRELGIVSLTWLTLGFGLFTLSLTKFHHYALPCAPPLAIGVGVLLDRSLTGALPRGVRGAQYLFGMALVAALLLGSALSCRDGDLLGHVLAEGSLTPASPSRAGMLLAMALGTWWLVERRLGPTCSPDDTPAPDSAPRASAALAIPSALLTLLVARDLWTTYAGDVPASARLLHLISYNYKRAWPETLDFEAVGFAFGVVAAALSALLAWRKLRSQAAVLLCTVSVLYGAFTLWIYLPRLAPHFGQRELLLAYYQARHGPEEPIVAYQMNWKGENFYTGNRLPAFVSSGAKFKNWLKAQRKRGTHFVFFVTEHGRMSTLKSELGANATVTQLTNRQLNDKFTLLRVELRQLPDAPDS